MNTAKIIFILKMAVDLAMITVLHCLSGYHLFGNRAHEILGILFFVLFLIHNGLNARQYRFLLRGRGAYPIVRTVVIALLWVCIAADAGSALVIARDTVPQGWSLPGAAVGRKVHMAAAAWSFVLMSLHTGFHAGMLTGIGRLCLRHCGRRTAAAAGVIGRLLVGAAAVYGAAAFILRRLYSDLFLLSEFKFMDFGESPMRFFADSFCMMILFCVLGWALKKGAERVPVLKRKQLSEKSS